MIKDEQYYLTLDLDLLARQIPRIKEQRGSLDVFGDAVTALALRCKLEPITTDYLLAIVGEPDVIKQIDQGEVWEYAWVDWYGPTKYSSATPFLIDRGRVVGLQRE